MWQAESQSGTGSIPVVLVLLYFIICYKLQFLWHIVTGYSVNGSMHVLGTCSVGSSPAILMSGVQSIDEVLSYCAVPWCNYTRQLVRVIRCTNVVQGSIPYCSILRQYLMRYLLLIVRNNKMRQSQLAVQTNGKRGFDSYYCYKIREKQMIILLFIIMLFISPRIALLILLLAINPVLVLVWLLAWLAIKLK